MWRCQPCNVQRFNSLPSGKHVRDMYTLKKSYKRPPYIFPSSLESKIRSITIHDNMSKSMSDSGSVSFCIPNCGILFTQMKHE